MSDISDETLAQVLARAGALLELAASYVGVTATDCEPLRNDARDMQDAAEACFAAARVLRGRA